jgi:hypothetical protein
VEGKLDHFAAWLLRAIVAAVVAGPGAAGADLACRAVHYALPANERGGDIAGCEDGIGEFEPYDCGLEGT